MADEEGCFHHLRVNFRSLPCILLVIATVFTVRGQPEHSGTLKVKDDAGERSENIANLGQNKLHVEKTADDIRHVMVTMKEDLQQVGNISTVETSSPFVNTTATAVPFVPLSSSICFRFLEDFGKASSRFTHCTVLHARPFRLCEECVHQYLSVKKYYNDIREDKCGDVLLKQDRVIIVQQTYDFAINLWDTAKCNGCFRRSNGTISYDSISGDATHFQGLLNETTKCFANSSDEFIPRTVLSLQSQEFSLGNSSACTVCRQCQGLYQNLSHFYNSMGTQEEICMDIVDAMNYTQYLWSQQFHCKTPVKNPVLIIAVSVLFCILPFFFYTGAKIHTVKRERKLVKQAKMQDFTSNTSSSSTKY